MGVNIRVAHDFNCPWCWIGLHQVERMVREFDVEVEWLSYELYPDELEWPDNAPTTDDNPIKPKTPGRLALAYAAEGMQPHSVKLPPKMRTHNAHEAALYAASVGVGTEFITRLYRAVWLEGKHANELTTIEEAARGLVPDIDELHKVISERRFASQIVGFNDPAYASGVYHVPTFYVGGERYAEQPYDVLRKALKDAGVPPRPEGVYADLQLPKGKADRPYVVMNMVATIDGKTVSGTRQQPVGDLGSKVDHASMRQIQDAVDAVLIGAGSLRATPGMWYPAKLYRFVATKSGNVDPTSRFFTDAPGKAFAIVSEDLGSQVPNGLNTLRCGHEGLCWKDAFHRMRQVFGIHRLLIEGGSEINAALLEHDVVDELFLTIAPKVKLGRETPTYAGGKPLSRDLLPAFELISERVAGDEVFLRYRRKKAE